MRSLIIKLTLTIALLMGAIISYAEEVQPELVSNIKYFYKDNECPISVASTNLSDIAQCHIDYRNAEGEGYTHYYSTLEPSNNRFFWYVIRNSDGVQTNSAWIAVNYYFDDAYQCPSSHPHIVSTDPNTGQPTLCTDLSPSCSLGAIIGSETLSNSGQDTACIPLNDGSGAYCSYSKKESYDVAFQPYIYYENSGGECSSLDPDVIENPYGMDDPSEWPQPDLGCSSISPTQQSCPADPNQECQDNDGVQICNSGCGWIEDEFVCISTMNNDNIDNDIPNPEGGDSDNDGNADEIGLLSKLDKNTDELEKIGRDQLKHLGTAVDKLDQLVNKAVGGGGISTSCDDCAKSSDLQSSDYSVTNETGSFDGTFWDEDLYNIQTELDDLYAQIKTEFNTLIGDVNQGNGSLPVYSITLPGGTTKQIDLSQYESQLVFLGSAVLFLFMIFAVFIILD